MKEKITKVAQDLEQGAITDTEALITLVISIRANFEVWRNGEMDDTKFSRNLNKNLFRIEKELGLIEGL